MHTVFRSGRLGRETPRRVRRDAFSMSKPVLLWAVVLAVTMLSFYVHLLNEQMVRANGLGMVPATMPKLVKGSAQARNTARPSAVQATERVAAR